jgi:hypothetical protein
MASLEHRTNDSGETWRVVWRQDVNGVSRKKQQRTFGDPAEAQRFKLLVEGYGNQWPPGWEPAPLVTAGTPHVRQWAHTAIGRRTRANERTKADYRRDLERHFATLLARPARPTSTPATSPPGSRTGRPPSCPERRSGTCTASPRRCSSTPSPSIRRSPAQPVRRRPRPSRRGPHRGDGVPDPAGVRHRPRPRPRSTSRFIRLLFGTGLRFGEATALTVADVDLLGKRKTVTVTKAWKRTGPASWAVGEPKTPRSRRTLSLSPELCDMLAPLWAGRNGKLLFPDRLGQPAAAHRGLQARLGAGRRPRQRLRRPLGSRSATAAASAPGCPTPATAPACSARCPGSTTCGTPTSPRCSAEGVRLEVISRRLGHSSITITFDRYGHLDPASDVDVNNAVDRLRAFMSVRLIEPAPHRRNINPAVVGELLDGRAPTPPRREAATAGSAAAPTAYLCRPRVASAAARGHLPLRASPRDRGRPGAGPAACQERDGWCGRRSRCRRSARRAGRRTRRPNPGVVLGASARGDAPGDHA